ncbi:Gfo/Idh/MocA family protein [Glaciecola petra]|uniref:Gfo/Idh/MocA family oxidoreductase n=1 Tax=Glaciecola petra TaxID=3075602 RepID=A0ABU2ZPU6_9ALTE|nr:Gfo/Idh/MocA family oxidoreductase [Aestuariibacter sp. P117]MDT0594625.1 Gfo/Idh/MocA family oxidoreductase [Aestuariibacter sp. P117]
MIKNEAKKTINIGVVGLGNIAQQHISNILERKVAGACVSAVCSRDQNALSLHYKQTHNINHYTHYQDLVNAKEVDAVIIATPTMSHFEIAKYALEQNVHVMLEKPIGLSSYEGEVLLSCQSSKTVFALMLNQRTDPVFAKMKDIVDSGLLGNIQRTHWTMTNWFRPEIYYQVSDWRATWKGEGGGLLVNQAIHNLDVFQWICGLPNKIKAFCEFGKYHNIEVEDEVTAFLRYPNGATGLFIGSTGEAPGINRFDIIGDKASLMFNSGRLSLCTNSVSTAEFSQQTDDMFGMPDTDKENIEIEEAVNQHAVIMSNFVAAIDKNEELIAPAADGLASLDIANAMLLSTWQNTEVSLPLDRSEYQQNLDLKIASSSLRTKSLRKANVDMSASYR